MNTTILQQYGLTMSRTSEKYDGYVSGPLEGYIYIFRHPDDISDFINDINLAINGQFNEIEDPDWGAGLHQGTYWFAFITPTNFEIRHQSQNETEKLIIPLQDWKEILLSWKECLE